MQIDFEYFYHSEETKFFTYFYTFVHFIRLKQDISRFYMHVKYGASCRLSHMCRTRVRISVFYLYLSTSKDRLINIAF